MRNPFSRVPSPGEFKSSPGELFKPVFSGRLLPDGSIRLTEVDKVDIKAEINSYRDLTDMQYILSRLAAGDTSVLTDKAPMYGDFTKFPSSYSEMMDMVIRAEDAFEALPVEVKQKFDNDKAKWFSSIGTSSWFEHMGVSRETPAPVPNSDLEVTNNESKR